MCGIPNNELKTLLLRIEDLREELYHNVKQGKTMLDPFVIKLSQDLDEQLNIYYRMTKKNSPSLQKRRSRFDAKRPNKNVGPFYRGLIN